MTNLIVKATDKENLDQMNVSADFYDALNTEVADLFSDAAQRAEANDRKSGEAMRDEGLSQLINNK